jgi:hypothetical protein
MIAGARALPRPATLLLLLPAAAAFLWLHSATVRLGFLGDDFQWWQHARMAVEQPRLLFAAFGGFRLVNTWLLALDHLLWGAEPAGFHLTNLALYLICGLLLWRLGRRLGLAAAGCAAVVSLWLVSPYSFEPSVVVSQRFEPVQLALWLGLALTWPGEGQRWTARRTAGALALAALTALNKESWIILPGLVVVLDRWLARRRWPEALARAAAAGAAVAVYLVLYARQPAIAPSTFFSTDLGGALKVPNAFAAFALIGRLQPGSFAVGLPELLAVAAVVALAVLAWRWRDTLTAFGLALFLLPFVPLLPIGWSTSRYTTIPLAGFLLAVAGAIRVGIDALAPHRRAVGRLAVGVAAAAVLAVNVAVLAGDVDDYRRLAGLHRPLLDEALLVAAEAARHDALLAVRLESEQPLVELSRSLAGIPKVFFVRGADPYTLIDWAALLTFVLDPVGGPVFADLTERVPMPARCTALAHVRGGFIWPGQGSGSCADEARAWRARPAPVKVLVRWRPG